MMKFALGVLFGFAIALGYYDGVVAQEYKAKIKTAIEAINRANSTIIEKNDQIYKLIEHIESMKAKEKRSLKFTSIGSEGC